MLYTFHPGGDHERPVECPSSTTTRGRQERTGDVNCGLVVPIIGIPLGVIGIVLGYFGRRCASQKNLATIGIVLSAVGIVLSCVPVGVIATMRLLGPKIGDTFSTISSSLP